MGNICGSESKPDPFAQPGRTLASAPPPQSTTSRPPASVKHKVGGPPHTLGGDSAAPARGDPRREAAEAAEVRSVTAFPMHEEDCGTWQHMEISGYDNMATQNGQELTKNRHAPALHPKPQAGWASSSTPKGTDEDEIR